MASVPSKGDVSHMRTALELAKRAAAAGEVPIGAVLVAADGEVLATTHNRPIGEHDASAHAEMLALRAGGARQRNYRLAGTTLYATLEPCVMCAAAIVHARVERLVYGARDPRAGAAGSVFQILQDPRLNHRVEICAEVLAAESSELLQAFFSARR
jgi:tRNA(adenine34) deaminase